MPSFDITSEVNKMELRNAVEQANKEIQNRFDFKGSDARIELGELELVVYADDDFKLKQVMDVLAGKCAKRGVDTRSLAPLAIEKVGGNKVKQAVEVKNGIDQEKAKQIVKLMKEASSRCRPPSRVRRCESPGAKKDDLQAAIQLVKKSVTDVPLQFGNFRD